MATTFVGGPGGAEGRGGEGRGGEGRGGEGRGGEGRGGGRMHYRLGPITEDYTSAPIGLQLINLSGK